MIALYRVGRRVPNAHICAFERVGVGLGMVGDGMAVIG